MASETEFQDYFSMTSRAQALMEIERWGGAFAILVSAVLPWRSWSRTP